MRRAIYFLFPFLLFALLGATYSVLYTNLAQTITSTKTFSVGGSAPFAIGATSSGIEVAGLRSATTTALAANGSNCVAGQAATGVDASGNAEGCAAVGTGDITRVGNCLNGDCGVVGGTDTFPLVYEGTVDAFQTTWTVTDPTAARAIVWPNLGGTVALQTGAGFTAGSIPYYSGGQLAQNNANLFWDNANTRLGIRTAVPASPLDVLGVNTSGQGFRFQGSVGANGNITGEMDNTNTAGFSKFTTRNGDGNILDMGITGSTYAGGGPVASAAFYYTNEPTIQLFTGGTERVRINATGVNLGAAAPTKRLDITAVNTSTDGIRVTGAVGANGSVLSQLENTNAAGLALFRGTNSDGVVLDMGITGNAYAGGGPAASSVFWYTGGNVPFELFTNGTRRFMIDTSARFSLSSSAPTKRLDIAGITTAGDGIRLTGAVATNNVLSSLENTTASGYVNTQYLNDAGDYLSVGRTGTTWAGGGPTGGANFLYGSAGYPMEFFTNGAERVRILSTGEVGILTTTLNADSKLEVAGHISSEGTAPTVSACGTTPSIVGSDTAGKVTIGTGVTTSCTVTFAVAYANAPPCAITGSSTAKTYGATSSTTVLTITSSADMASDVIMYICIGRG